MPKLEVVITREDIWNGVRRDCNACPIALAVKRLVNPSTVVSVNGSSVILKSDKFIFRSSLPSQASDFVERFDNRSDAEPFSFNLYVPEGYLCQA